MAEPVGSNGNVLAAPVVGVLNDVWDQATHALRFGYTNGLPVTKTITFNGGTLNDPGDFDGSGTPWNLFSVTGSVQLAIIGVCTTTLTGASGTLAVGVSGSTNRFIPVTTGTTITSGRTIDLSGLVTAGTAPKTAPTQAALTGVNIIGTTATADITAGVITFYCFFQALTPGATVAAL